MHFLLVQAFFFFYHKGSILSLKQTVIEGPGKQFYLKM